MQKSRRELPFSLLTCDRKLICDSSLVFWDENDQRPTEAASMILTAADRELWMDCSDSDDSSVA